MCRIFCWNSARPGSFGRRSGTVARRIEASLQTVEYSDFSLLAHQRFAGKRVPMDVSIEMTRRCPLDCLHCYNNLPMGDQEARLAEMTLAEHVALLDELVAAGSMWILYSGGEIFARKDFLEIYTQAKKRGFLITLFTNGILINERIADYLAEYPPVCDRDHLVRGDAGNL